MTSQPHYRGKITHPGSQTTWLKWVPAVAVLGGVAGALASFLFHQRDLSLGLLWGSALTVLNFYSLKILTEKLLSPASDRKRFWFWNFIRWAFLALSCWALLSVSPTCLGGAFLSYLWFLMVLAPGGMSFSKSKDIATGQSKFF